MKYLLRFPVRAGGLTGSKEAIQRAGARQRAGTGGSKEEAENNR